MSFREDLLNRVVSHLRALTTTPTAGATAEGLIFLTPNLNKAGVLRGVHVGPLEDTITDDVSDEAKNSAPVAYVSFDGGRHDLGIDTLLSHIVEVLGIRVEVVLNKKIGVRQGNVVRPIPFQVSDLLSDMDDFVSVDHLGRIGDDEVVVQDAVIEEWELDDRYRGGDIEVLSLVIQVQVADERAMSGTTP